MNEVSRRDALRLGAVGLSSLIAGPALAGCGSSTSGGTSAPANTPGPALAPFDDTRPAGAATGLAKRVAWANTADIGIFVALGNGMKRAATDTGLGYVTANAAGNPQTNVNQMNTFLARGVGGMTVQPLNAAAQTPVMQRALDQGVCVVGIINHPCTLQIAASQYRIGYDQGKAAADYIKAHLGGRATVFNQNQVKTNGQLALRNVGLLKGLRTGGPGIKILDTYVTVAQQSTPANIFSLMTTELQSHPDINVVLGDDNFVLAAYRAFEQTGKLKPEMYFSGVDGDAQSLELIKQGTPYRASLAFAWPLMGYGMGRFSADWIAGRQIPRVMVANTTLLDSPAAVRAFEADNRDLKGTFENRSAYERYFPLLGNVSYADRKTFWDIDYIPR